MGNVYLIRPRWKSLETEENFAYNRQFFPLSLAYCSSLLKRAGFQTVFRDFQGDRALDVEDEVSRVRPEDIVFITSSDMERWVCPQLDLDPVFSIARLARERTENMFIMGPHGTIAPDMVLERTQAKAVIRGAPEGIILRLAEGESLEGIRGISYREGGTLHHTPDADDLDMDRLPFPDFSILSRTDYRYEIFRGRFVLLESSRNCPFSCTFCYRGMHGKAYRMKSVRRVMEEIKSAMRNGAKGGTFIDLDLAFDRAHIVNLCTVMRAEAPCFKWCCQTRAENLDEDVIALMAQAGCLMIGFGVESADQRRLTSLRKRVSPEDVARTFEVCRRHGIQTLCFLCVGFPRESLEEAQRTIDLGLQLRPTYLTIHFATGFRGTPFYDTLLGPENWYRLEPSVGKREQLKKMARKAYLRHYLRPSSLKEHLTFRSLPGYFTKVKLFLSYLR